MPPRRKSTPQETPEIDSYEYGSATRKNAPNADNAAMLHRPGQPAATALAEKKLPPLVNDPENYSRPFLQWRWPSIEEQEERAYGPLYVHEKISPALIFQGLMQKAQQGQERQMGLFAQAREAFNGFKTPSGEKAFNAANEPYQYDNGHWTNRLIRATAQRAMRSLLHEEGLAGKINLIYLDPPYNKKFGSNFAPAANQFKIKENQEGIPNDPVAIQAFRDSYVNGVHSYLDGLQEQMELARQMLTDDGSIIVQIGPGNLHYVAVLMSQVFGQENHVATIPYVAATNQSTKMLPEIGNWLIWFAKNKPKTKYHQLYEKMELDEDLNRWARFSTTCELPDDEVRQIKKAERKNPHLLPKGTRIYVTYGPISDDTSFTGRSDTYYHHENDEPCDWQGWTKKDRAEAAVKPHHDHICTEDCDQPLPENWAEHTCTAKCDGSDTRKCPKGRKCSPSCSNAYPCPTDKHWSVSLKGLHSIAQQNRLVFTKKNIRYKGYFDESPGWHITANWPSISTARNKQYPVETPPTVLERCILMTTDPGDLVLDLTCGSGAMPVQCETWGRRWLAVDVSATSIAIARDRILSGVYPYHLLQDSPEGHEVEHHLNQKLLETNEPFAKKDHYSKDPAQGFVLERQIRVSAATLAYGPKIPQDIIYHPDRTFKDDKRLRPASNFEVCSDSPYRALSPDQILAPEERVLTTPDSPEAIAKALTQKPFELDPIQVRTADNLALSGISKGDRLQYSVKNLQPLEHPSLTHTAIIVDPQGEEHKAGFYLGKADEIISYTKVANAAQVAKTNAFTYLGVVGFSHNGDVHKAAKNIIGINVLNISAHRDLQLSNLKDQKRPNGFIIISEPEVQLIKQPDNQISLKVLGINAFDPEQGIVDLPSVKHIKAIMVDCAYDNEKFITSHYNLPQTEKNKRAYRNLAAAFKGDISDETWQKMQSAETMPFPLPTNGLQIAVKVIDQTGTEHMTVIQDPTESRWY